MSMHLRTAIRCASALAVAFLVGCDDGPTVPEDITGTYTMTSQNGNPLPVAVESDSERTELVSGSLVLGEGTWELTANLQVTDLTTDEVTTATLAFDGTYTRDGANLALIDPDPVFAGLVDGTTVTLTATDSQSGEPFSPGHPDYLVFGFVK